jgi:hypothetical protein
VQCNPRREARGQFRNRIKRYAKGKISDNETEAKRALTRVTNPESSKSKIPRMICSRIPATF